MKSTKSLYETISTATHEAAHIIVASLCQMRVIEATLSSAHQGETKYHIDNADLRSQLGVLYSGCLAEKLLYQSLTGKTNVPRFITRGSSHDYKQARAMFKNNLIAPVGKERDNYKKMLFADINRITGQIFNLFHTLYLTKSILMSKIYSPY